MDKMKEISLPESIVDTEKWITDEEIMEIFYENYNPNRKERCRMGNDEFVTKAKELVYNRAITLDLQLDRGENPDVYVVWLSKTLQNNKALLSTTIPDGRYYEVTYNGDKNEIYFDSYVKEFNEAHKLGE